MYGIQDEYIPLDKIEILKRVSQEEIFKMIFGEYPVIGKSYLSPLRNDNTAGCYFGYYGGKLYFIDFTTTPSHYDCFNMVQKYYNLTFRETLEYVNSYFSLGLEYGGIVKPIIYNKPLQSNGGNKSGVDIMFKARNFNENDRNYWLKKYDITDKQLTDDDVYPIIWYKIFDSTDNVRVVRPKNATYAYTGFEYNRVKLYSPYSPKKKGKWISNCIADDVGQLDMLPLYGNKLIVSKAYKDSRILRNYGVNSVWFQNEGTIPNVSILVNLCKRFDEIIILFDNDKAGIDASERIMTVINSHCPKKSRRVFIPEKSDCKDPSDFYEKYGRIELLSILVKNKII